MKPSVVEQALEGKRKGSDPVPAEFTRNRHRLRAVIYLSAWGMDPTEISSKLGMDLKWVKNTLKSKSVQAEVHKVQDELFMKNPEKIFQKLLPKAIRTTHKILRSSLEKGSTRLAAANMIMDRALGKPTQEIKHEGSMIRSLIEQMDRMNNGPIIETTKSVEEAILSDEGLFKEINIPDSVDDELELNNNVDES